MGRLHKSRPWGNFAAVTVPSKKLRLGPCRAESVKKWHLSRHVLNLSTTLTHSQNSQFKETQHREHTEKLSVASTPSPQERSASSFIWKERMGTVG
eukprot:g36328.t1